jgi:hypothetical protein
MILSVHQPQYLSWLGYFDKIDRSDVFVFLDNVQYKEREFQNRNKIRTQNGWMWLTVPVVSKGLGRQKICDVAIDNTCNWQKRHWKSLKSWYARAKFFGEHCGFFEEVYKRKWDRLVDLNIYIINYLLRALTINKPIYTESELNIRTSATERIIQICKKLKVDTYLSGSGGKMYLEEDKFGQAGIKLGYQEFAHPVYDQPYTDSRGFLPFMSVVDLMFNHGRESLEIIRKANRRS